MSKTYMFCCPKHGVLRIEVEKPPILSRRVFCPWCASEMSKAEKVEEEKKEMRLEAAQA